VDSDMPTAFESLCFSGDSGGRGTRAERLHPLATRGWHQRTPLAPCWHRAGDRLGLDCWLVAGFASFNHTWREKQSLRWQI